MRPIIIFLLVALLLAISNKQSFCGGILSSDGNCYGYYWKMVGDVNNPYGGISWKVTQTEPYVHVWKEYTLIPPTKIIDFRRFVYNPNGGTWGSGYTGIVNGWSTPVHAEGIAQVMTSLGIPESVYPHTYAPYGCMTPCEIAEQKLKEKCGVNYHFDSDTCEGCCIGQDNAYEECSNKEQQFGECPD